jgi:UDP-N-acetylglucosamine 2-epimerase (hydrolysing)
MKLLFITGTRADYGKLKPLIEVTSNHSNYEIILLATGMHLHAEYGNTYLELLKDNYCEVLTCITGHSGNNVVESMANLMSNITYLIIERNIDAIVVHGDRPEALAGATAGALNNIKVIHVEGGEVSGTIDDSIRHAVTKLSHIHLCNSETAKNRLIQLGESHETIEIIGSPDLDILLDEKKLPVWEEVLKRYPLPFDSQNFFVIAIHPVTTEYETSKKQIQSFFNQIQKVKSENFIIINPNNDLGSEYIIESIELLRKSNPKNIIIYKSFRFEFFLRILKNSKGLIGNSSAGLHEGPAIGLPVLNYGSRQNGRFNHECVTNVSYFETNKILTWINKYSVFTRHTCSNHYGNGKSQEKFKSLLDSNVFKTINIQKHFNQLL